MSESSAPYIYANTTLLSAGSPVISVNDRAFRFGDGIFETVLVVDGCLVDFGAHEARLRDGLRHFRIGYDTQGLRARCEALVQKNQCQSGYVRIIISRGENGEGAMGYKPGVCEPLCIIQTVNAPFPEYRTIRLYVSSRRAFEPLPCKTNSAMLYTMAMLEAADHACDNALILDMAGNVCETASGNLFWVKDEVIYTPESTLPFVPGTVRKKVLALSPLPVKEGRFAPTELLEADEIFMTNVGGIVAAISAIEPLGYVAKGDDVTQNLRELLVADIRQQSRG